MISEKKDFHNSIKNRLKKLKDITGNKTDDPEYRKKYYQQNKELIKAHVYQRTQCECGSFIMLCNMSKHKKTRRHFSNLELLEN